jgi:hypothetical protein
MSAAFLLGTPLVIGAIAVYGSPPARNSFIRAIGAPLLPTALMLVGTAITLLEGSICIAIMAPLFFVVACIGGLCMYVALKIVRIPRSSLGALAALPLFLLPLERSELPDTFHELRESVIVNATARGVAHEHHALDRGSQAGECRQPDHAGRRDPFLNLGEGRSLLRPCRTTQE